MIIKSLQKAYSMIKLSRNLHIYLSLFFLPMALLYALTGIFFICGIDADFNASYQHYKLENINIKKGKNLLQYLNF